MTHSEKLKAQINELEQKLSQAHEKELREKKFAEEANERFEKNLICFRKFFPNIASAIEGYQPREDFCIHVTSSGHGNFVCKSESTPIYSDFPLAQAQEQVNKSIESPTFTLTSYSHYPKTINDSRLHIKYMKKLGKFIERGEGKHEPLDKLLSHFPTAVIFGIGLGYHIPILLEKTSFDYVFIIEPDFEVFFASLYCTDWYEIIKTFDRTSSCLFLFIGASKDTLIADLKSITEDIGAFSIVRSFCYQHTPMQELNSVIKSFFQGYFQFQFGHGFYDDALTSISHTIKNIKGQLPFWNGSKLVERCFQDVPVVVVGNGPSLDDSEEFLKKNQNNIIILAAGTAISSLLKMGIKPDFHVQIERPKRNYEILLDTLNKEDYSDLNLLTTNVIYSETPKLYKWTGLAVKGNEAGSEYYALLRLVNKLPRAHSIPYCNPLVANTALSFACSFGFKNVYLFGVDNAISEDGSHHSKHSIYNDQSLTRKYSAKKGYDIPLEGNVGGKVFANKFYAAAKDQMESLIKIYPEVNFFNVGQGAKLHGAIPLHESELLIEELSVEKTKVVEYLKNNQFEADELEDVDDAILDLKAFDTIANNILEISSIKYSSRADYLDMLRRQARYVYSLRAGRYSYYFHVFKGSLLYYHCPMITLLYNYSDEDKTIELFEKALQLWNEYLKEIIADFPESYNKSCNWSLN